MSLPPLPEMAAPGYDSVTRAERVTPGILPPWFYLDRSSGLVKTSRRSRRARKYRLIVRTLWRVIVGLVLAVMVMGAALVWQELTGREQRANMELERDAAEQAVKDAGPAIGMSCTWLRGGIVYACVKPGKGT